MESLSGWILIAASVIGHTEWWIILVNRSHALPIRAAKLRRFRALHDLAVLLYPLLLLVLLWCCAPGLLAGGKLSDQPLTIRWLLWLTSAGCVPAIFGTLRWQLSGHTAFREATSRTRHDVETCLPHCSTGRPDVRGRRHHPLKRLPRNEVFSLEVNRKSVRIDPVEPGSPPDDAAATETTLRILHISDLHFVGCPGPDYYAFLVRQAMDLRPDLVVFTGDLIDDPALLAQATELLSPLPRVAPCVFILGNHDWRFDDAEIRQSLTASGWRGVTDSPAVISLSGLTVLIAGSERPWMGGEPPGVRQAGCDLRILACHTPDRYRQARRDGYQLMLSGHTHGGQVVLPVVGPVYSPSLFGVRFASGLFRWPGFALHVSRGAGARDPLRWNCLPELTCLDVSVRGPAAPDLAHSCPS